MEKKKVEILAPAGSWDSMKAAVAAGADGVYMGGSRFGARAYADNTDERGMVEAINYVHIHGRRLYMTVNTLFKEGELEELAGYMRPYYLAGLDGVIVQDLGALGVLKANFPGLELHASTQMTITSAYGARMVKELGCCRVVPARELSLAEIRRIHDEADVEIECFVHGALCYCYSGQCLMSSLIGGRSGNRGRCAQPCRLPYTVYGTEGGCPQKPLNRENERYVLSLKDLCTLDILPDLIEAGVYSLKIEGRMKSPRYTAGVVRIYRKYVDQYLEKGREGYYVEPEDRGELLELFDRGGFTSGYYGVHNGREMVALKEKPEFREGNRKLFDFLDKTYVEAELKEPAECVLTLEQGAPSRLTLKSCGAEATVEGQAPEAAQKQPMTAGKAEKQINKTGGTPFTFTKMTTDIKGELFLTVQALNELRRRGLEALEEKILDRYRNRTGGEHEGAGSGVLFVAAGRGEEKEGSAGMGAGDRELPVAAGREGEKEDSAGMGAGDRELSVAAGREGEKEGSAGMGAGNRELSVMTSIEGIEGSSAQRDSMESHSRNTGPEYRRKPEHGEPGPLQLTVSLEAPSQLAAVLACRDVSLVYVDAGGFQPGSWKDAANRCHRAGKRCFLMLPQIFRSQAIEYFRIHRELLRDAGFDGLLVKAMEEIRWLGDGGMGLPFRLDASVYGWNSGSIETLASTGAEALTLPLELNFRELEPVLAGCRALGKPAELIVYGHGPMMVSAQCVTRTVNGCSRKPGILRMKDRTGAMLPVKNHCAFCFNTIYNSLPTSLLGLEDMVKRMGVSSVRLAFTLEDEGRAEAVLEAFARAFLRGEAAEAPCKEFTRGHFKRGVE